MCYKINQHHQVHDVRPRVAYKGISANVELVNPYSMPKPCCKQQDAAIARWFVCPYGHGCCYLTCRIVKCYSAADDNQRHCGHVTPFHTYEQRPAAFKSAAGPIKLEGLGAWEWPPLCALDQEIGLPENCHASFQPYREVVCEMEQDVEDAAQELEQVLSEFSTLRVSCGALESGWRCDSHDICERVLQPHECREFAVQKELQRTRDRLGRLEAQIQALQIRSAVRRLRFDATAFGFTGSCDISNLPLGL